MDSMTRQYLETALWSSVDENDTPYDKNNTIADFSEETINQAISDCEQFLSNAEELIPNLLDGYDLEQIGHDFWLTRNHHGAGFWDGDYSKKHAKILTDLSHEFGELNIAKFDNELIFEG